LKKHKGAIQTDGYTVYDYFEYVEGVTLLGCMAHVRRKFIDAQMNCWYAVVAKNPYRVTATPHTTPLCSIANLKCAYTQLARLCNS